MKKETKEVQVKDMITPAPNRVLVELVRESSEYTPGVTRLNPQIEPYLKVINVSETLVFPKVGDLIVTRNMPYEAFKLYNKEYSVIYQSDIIAVISKEVATEIKNQVTQKDETIN